MAPLLAVYLQADASGSLEAIKAALGALPQDNVVLRFLLAAANDITESDIDLAFASEGYIIGFNVSPSEAVQAAAKNRGGTRAWCASRVDCSPVQVGCGGWGWDGDSPKVGGETRLWLTCVLHSLRVARLMLQGLPHGTSWGHKWVHAQAWMCGRII